jgi:hypothetical protein
MAVTCDEPKVEMVQYVWDHGFWDMWQCNATFLVFCS